MNWQRRKVNRPGIFAVLMGIILLLVLTSAPPTSVQAQQALVKPLQYDVVVTLKLIQVYVTDKKGRPVTDLGRDEFVVTDNGRPIVISEFEKHAFQPPEGAGAVKTAAPVPAVRRPNRRFFLFFDFAYNNPRGMLKAKEAALHFLDNDASPEDEIAILSYSSIKGMSVHEYLTTDHAKIRKVVESIGLKNINGRADDLEDLYQRVGEEGPGGSGGILPAVEANALLMESWMGARNFVSRMAVLAKAMRLIPGQKQFILFSSGVPGILTRDGGNEARNVDLEELREGMHRDFAASGCTVFTFDTRPSAMGTSLFGYDERTLEDGKRSMFKKGGASQNSSSIFLSDKDTGYKSLHSWAKETGGKYYSNIDLFEKNLGQVETMTGTYYVLGYSIDERADGVFHEVDVTVKRKGCQVRTPAGYFSPKPFSEYTNIEKQLHLFDLALNERALSRMPDKVPMSALSSTAEGATRLAVLAKLSGEITAKLAGKRVEFVAIFFDGNGEISDVIREEADPASLRGHDLAFAAGTTIKPGAYSCRLVIRDMDTGLSAVASAKATIGKPLQTELQLGTPLMLEAQTGGSLLCAGAKKAKEGFPWADIYPFDSSLFSPVLPELSPAAASIQVVVPCAIPGGGQSDLSLSANLVNSTSGERSPITITRVDRVQRGPLEILTLEIPTAGITPGTYYFHIYAQDRASGSLGHTFTTLVIPRR